MSDSLEKQIEALRVRVHKLENPSKVPLTNEGIEYFAETTAEFELKLKLQALIEILEVIHKGISAKVDKRFDELHKEKLGF